MRRKNYPQSSLGFAHGAGGPAPPVGTESRPTYPAGLSRREPKAQGWDLLLVLAAGLLLVGQARVHVFIPGVSALRPALVLGALALGVWIFRAQHDRERSIRRLLTGIGLVGCFLFGWAVIGIPFAYYQGRAFYFVLDVFSRSVLVFLVVAAAVRSVEDVRRLLGVVATGAVLFAIMASQGSGAQAVRAGGYDPNDSAMFLVSGVPILVYFTLFGRRKLTRLAAALGVLAALFAIVDSQSRGGFLGMVAVLAFMTLFMQGVRPILRIAVVAAVVLGSIPAASSDYWERMETIAELDDGYGGEGALDGRRNVWSRGKGYALANPLTGVGISNFSVAEGMHPDIRARIESGRGAKYSAAHSQWIQVLAELGFPGLLAFCLLFVLGFRRLLTLKRLRWRPSDTMSRREFRVLAEVMMATLVGLMVAGSFLSNAYSAMIWGPLGLLLGLFKVTSKVKSSGPAQLEWPDPRRARTTEPPAPLARSG